MGLFLLSLSCQPNKPLEGPILDSVETENSDSAEVWLIQAQKELDEGSYQHHSDRFDEVTEKLLKVAKWSEQPAHRVKALISLGIIENEVEHFELSQYYLDSALNVSQIQLVSQDTLLAELYMAKSDLHRSLEEYEKTQSYIKQAQAIREATFGKIHPKVAECNFNLGSYHRSIKNYDSAILYYFRALENLGGIESHNLKKLARINQNIGYALMDKGERDSSAYYFRKAIRLYGDAKVFQHPELANCINKLGLIHYFNSNYDSAQVYFQQALDMRRATLRSPHPSIALSYENVANAMWNQGDFLGAEEYMLKTLEENMGAFGKMDNSVVTSYQRLGDLNSNMHGNGNSRKDVFYQKQALKILLSRKKTTDAELAEAYKLVGRALGELGSYEKGIVYSQKALTLYQDKLEKRKWELNSLTLLDNIGFFYERMGEYEEALQIHEKHFKYCLANLGQFHNRTGFGAFHLARDLYFLQEYDKAAEYFKKAREIWSKILPPQHPRTGFCTYFLAQIENIQGNYLKAQAMLEENVYSYMGSNQVQGAYNSLGFLLLRQKKFEEALSYFQMALQDNMGRTDSLSYSYNPLVSDTYNDGFRLVVSLSGKVKTMFNMAITQDSIQQRANLVLVVETANRLKEWVEFLRLDFEPGFARHSLMIHALEAYEAAVQAVEILIELEPRLSPQLIAKAFDFFQARKSHSLLESTIEEKAKRFANIPTALIEKENKVRELLSIQKRRLQKEELKQTISDSSSIFKLREEVFQLETQYEDLVKTLEEKYPAYYQLKYQIKTATLEDVQDRLIGDEATAVLEYMLGDSTLFILGIIQENARLISVPYDASLKSGIDSLNRMLASRTEVFDQMNNEKQIDRFCRVSFLLYQRLLESIVGQLGDKPIQSLIIIPEGKLGYIPFDVLLTEPPDSSQSSSFASISYAIHMFEIRYGYSSTLLLENQRRKSRARQSFAGFAPKYEATGLWAEAPEIQKSYGNVRSDFSPLENNQPEVKGAASLMGGTSFLAELATEEKFKQEAQNFKILHLAMHALTNDKDPMSSCLVFTDPEDLRIQIQAAQKDTLGLSDAYTEGEDGKLYAHEIYNLPLDADLAVLSACNTGVGTIRKGEGLMSLARAFAYAGCPNVLMSLWQADDQATQKLMQGFYQNLKAGMEKDEALRQAKLSYMEEADISHPHLWSGFVIIGDDTPILFSSYFWKLSLVVMVILAVLSLFLVLRGQFSVKKQRFFI